MRHWVLISIRAPAWFFEAYMLLLEYLLYGWVLWIACCFAFGVVLLLFVLQAVSVIVTERLLALELAGPIVVQDRWIRVVVG